MLAVGNLDIGFPHFAEFKRLEIRTKMFEFIHKKVGRAASIHASNIASCYLYDCENNGLRISLPISGAAEHSIFH